MCRFNLENPSMNNSHCAKGDLRLVYENGVFYTQHMSRSRAWVDKREHKPFCGQYYSESHYFDGVSAQAIKIEIGKVIVWLKAERVQYEKGGMILSNSVLVREFPPEVTVIGEVSFPIELKIHEQIVGRTPARMEQDRIKEEQQKKEYEEALKRLPTDPETIVREILSKGRTRKEIIRAAGQPGDLMLRRIIRDVMGLSLYNKYVYPTKETLKATLEWLNEHIKNGHLVMPR